MVLVHNFYAAETRRGDVDEFFCGGGCGIRDRMDFTLLDRPGHRRCTRFALLYENVQRMRMVYPNISHGTFHGAIEE